MSRRSAAFVGLALLLTALPAAAVDSVLYRGIDPWTTDPVSTSANFLKDPLPMGFFCADFPGFDGQIWLRGVPLTSDASGELGTADTIVERLDNAVFNKSGVARTRVRVRALQLESIESFKTVCGDYNVKVTLDGEQPITRMRIVRESAAGGRFFVPLALNVKFTFTRVDDPSDQLEFAYPVRFAVNPHHRWEYKRFVPGERRAIRVSVDTDWDGTPDTALPGRSNFDASGNKAFCAEEVGSIHGVY